MDMKRWMLPACGLLAMLAGASAAFAASVAPVSAVGKLFSVPEPGWLTGDAGFGGPAEGTWTYALTKKSTWSNFRLSATVNLTKAANRQDGMELGSFYTFNNLESLGGYEAGLVFCYQGPKRFYRIAISSLWKELILWRSSGGVVQAVSYPFEVGKSYALAVSYQGSRIRVSVDGKEVMDWWETADPIGTGKAGLARKEGDAYFTAAKIESLSSKLWVAPTHVASFHERQWHNMRFFFDGNEPVFVLTPTNMLDLMKFRPGYRPILYAFNFISDWSRFYTTKITKSAVVKDGDRLILDVTAVDPNTKSPIPCDSHLVVTYDAASNLYTYDHTCTIHLPQEEAGKVAPSWDHGDSVFLGGVGSSITRDPNYPRPTYQWTVYEAPDGKYYKLPLNHNSHYRASAASNGGPLKVGGFGLVEVGDPVLSPIVRVPEASANYENSSSFGHCPWAYDIHTMFVPKKVDGKIQPGDYVSRVVYAGMNAVAAQALLAKAEYYQPLDLTFKIPVYAAGTTGLVERFDKVVLQASPHSEYRIYSGAIDDKVGHGDTSSLRLDGPAEAWTLTGSSYFSGGYAKKVRVSGWVKTQDVTGEGPTIGFSRSATDGAAEFHAVGITGTKDWTPFSYVTAFPGTIWGITLYWRNSGSGTVWFDDFKVDWLDDKAEVSPSGNFPINPPNADIVLNWKSQGTERSVSDASGYGSHGKFYGDVAWTEVEGQRVLTLDGKTGYIWPLSSPNLTLGPDTTMVFDLKPETGGYLVWWGWGVNYIISGAAPKFQLQYQAAGKTIGSKPILDANAWQKLAIVVTKGTIRYYINGQLADTVEANTFAASPVSYLMSTWHRHLSFFGYGNGDYEPVPPISGGNMKGQVRSVTVYKRALTAEEIAKL
ncbi:MAG: LamG-like jellyroll fold domain-containing protein [Armatimonadota bacterium]